MQKIYYIMFYIPALDFEIESLVLSLHIFIVYIMEIPTLTALIKTHYYAR